MKYQAQKQYHPYGHDDFRHHVQDATVGKQHSPDYGGPYNRKVYDFAGKFVRKIAIIREVALVISRNPAFEPNQGLEHICRQNYAYAGGYAKHHRTVYLNPYADRSIKHGACHNKKQTHRYVEEHNCARAAQFMPFEILQEHGSKSSRIKHHAEDTHKDPCSRGFRMQIIWRQHRYGHEYKGGKRTCRIEVPNFFVVRAAMMYQPDNAAYYACDDEYKADIGIVCIAVGHVVSYMCGWACFFSAKLTIFCTTT